MAEALPLLLLSDDGGAATVLSLVPPPLLRRWAVAEVSVMVGRIFYEAVDAAAGFAVWPPAVSRQILATSCQSSLYGRHLPPAESPTIDRDRIVLGEFIQKYCRCS